MEMKRPLEAEFLSILIANKEFSPAVVLEPEDFLDPRHAAVFQALRRLKTDASPIALEREVKAIDPHFESEYLEVLISLDTGQEQTLESIEARAGQIREDRLRWAARAKLRGVVAKFDDPQAPLQDLLDAANEIVTSTGEGLLGQKHPTAPEILERAYQQKAGVRFSSGLSGIDRLLSAGGMKQGHCWVVSAKYKGYKTTTALNIADALLKDGRSVCYVATEDTDIAFTEMLSAIHSGIPVKLVEDWHAEHIKIADAAKFKALEETERWLRNDVGNRWRVYDPSYGALHWKKLPTLLASDKILHNADVVILDYVQALASEYSELEAVAQMLVKVAAERQVCLVVLSQWSNDTIRNNSDKNMLSTKGSGAFGSIAHVGAEILHDPETSHTRLTPELLKEIDAGGVQHFASMTSGPPIQGSKQRNGPADLVEIVVNAKVVRRGKRGSTALLLDSLSGKCLLQYDTPRYMELS